MRIALFLSCVLMVCGSAPALAEKEAPTAASDASSARPIAVAPISVGGEKQLFIDNRFIADSRNVELCMNPPVKLGVVLRPERPWEDKSIGFCASVIEHDGVFKLFYRADGREKGASVCLATSRDGLHWERPRIGLYEHGGNKDNNIVFRDTDNSAAYRGVGETIVFLDPHGSAEQRFKMIASKGWPDPKTAGLYCHTSPDGVHWTAGPRVLDICPDTANQAAWDRQRGKYVAYIRIWDPLRKVGRVEMDDIMAPWPYTPLGAEAYFIWGKENVAVPSREFAGRLRLRRGGPRPERPLQSGGGRVSLRPERLLRVPQPVHALPRAARRQVRQRRPVGHSDGGQSRRRRVPPGDARAVHPAGSGGRARLALELHGRRHAPAGRLPVPVLRRLRGDSRPAGSPPEDAHRLPLRRAPASGRLRLGRRGLGRRRTRHAAGRLHGQASGTEPQRLGDGGVSGGSAGRRGQGNPRLHGRRLRRPPRQRRRAGRHLERQRATSPRCPASPCG